MSRGVALLLGLTAAAPATAKVYPPACAVPCGITLVGCTGGAADPIGRFQVQVRDVGGIPIPSSTVVVDFSGCCATLQLSSAQLEPGMILDPSSHTVRAITDGTGTATFCIMGAALGGVAGPGTSQVNVFADGVCLTCGWGHLPVGVAAFDLDGAGGATAAGVGPSDLSVWLGDVFGQYQARSDFDYADAGCTAAITSADLSRWLQVYFSAGSTGNPPTLACP